VLGFSVIDSWRDWRAGCGRYLLVGSRWRTHARCSRNGRGMSVDQDGTCFGIRMLVWHGRGAGVVLCCFARSKKTN
jgi:hypothetical protein